MNIIFLLIKIIWLSILLIEGIKLVINLKKIAQPTIQFDLVSIFEMATTFGLSLALLGSRVSSSNATYMSIILLSLAVIVYFEFKRIIIIGEKECIIRNRRVLIADIEKYKVVYARITIGLPSKAIHIMNPLSSRAKMNILVANVMKES